ncbi:hypothetical protein DL98DRAFT_168721 [Cadophora sp. DSE1049]|nr:hypothetical protein DL98DRAFT_168721 [Cadophora sp. DSE1049]
MGDVVSMRVRELSGRTAVAGSGDALLDPQILCVVCSYCCTVYDVTAFEIWEVRLRGRKTLRSCCLLARTLHCSHPPPLRSPPIIAPQHNPICHSEPRVNCQVLRTIRYRVAVAFEVAVATRKSIVLLAMLLSWRMMGWQLQGFEPTSTSCLSRLRP